MIRNIRIASALALVGALAAASPIAASAGGPLLSGYGGPGAGEQAIIGSTLLGGPGGGAGSNGSLGSNGSSGSGRSAGQGGSGGPSSSGSGAAQAGAGGSTGSSAGAAKQGGGAQAGLTSGTHSGEVKAPAFVYPIALRSASADSPALGISGGDALLILAAIATLALIGTITIRLARLQR